MPSRRDIWLARLEYKPPPGFTLMEVLISMTIMAVIVLLIFTSLRVGARAWGKGEREIDTIHRQRVVLSLIQEQIASISTKKLAMLKNKPYYLVGNQERLDFLSTRSLIPGTEEGVIKVTYRVVTEETTGLKTLTIKEENLLTPQVEKEKSEADEDAFRILINGLSELTIEYLNTQSSKEDYSWVTGWNGNSKQIFPQAVRLRLNTGEQNYSTIVSELMSAESKK